jgi:hypoxanthine phosphoribosyltransferase
MQIVLSQEELSEGIARLARSVRADLGRQPVTVVGVLTGSIVLVADLIRSLDGPVRVGMVWASSYRGTATSPGQLDLRLDLLPDLTGQHVLVVDDIFDTGRTLEGLLAELRQRGAASVRSLVLLKKTGRAEVSIEPDYVGFEIPDRFVIGYGLDFDGGWRHLPYLAALEPEEIDAARSGHDISSPVDSGNAAHTP